MEELWSKGKIRIQPVTSLLSSSIFVIFAFPVLFWFYWVCRLRAFLVDLLVKLKHGKRAYLANGTDAVWTSDIPDAYYPITTVLFLSGTISIRQLQSRVKRQVLQVEELRKLRRRQSDEFGLFLWRDEENFAIENHVVREKSVSGDDQLQTILAQLSGRSFEPKFSPWRLHLIPIADTNDSCVVFCVDHSVADGLSLVRVFMTHVMDVPEEIPLSPVVPRSVFANPPLRFEQILRIISSSPSVFRRWLSHRERHVLHGPPLSKSKIIRWSRPILLDELRQVRKMTKTTFNDIYLSCLTGAIRRHFMVRSPSAQNLVVTSIIPIALPPTKSQNDQLVNNISVVLLPLPVHIADPVARVSAMAKIMKDGKQSPEMFINAWAFKTLANCMPLGFSRRIFRTTPATLVSSTVPGPPNHLSVWGHPLEKVLYYSPHRGATGITSCLISYAGKATLTLYVDESLVDNSAQVDQMIKDFTHEIDILVKLSAKVNV